MSNTFVKSQTQTNIFNPYHPVDGVCDVGDPSITRQSEDLVGENETICYKIDKTTCPDLNGSLVSAEWDEKAPNVKCTYDLDKLTDNEHILEYIKHYGKDIYFEEVIMPEVFQRITNNCPNGMDGVVHSSCLKILEKSEVGKLCQQWAKSHQNQANLYMRKYAEKSTSSDCDCIKRGENSYYKAMKEYNTMKKVQAADWYAPCRRADRYLIPSDITASGNKVNKRVSAAANFIARKSPQPQRFKNVINNYSDISIQWDRTVQKHIEKKDTVSPVQNIRLRVQPNDIVTVPRPETVNTEDTVNELTTNNTVVEKKPEIDDLPLTYTNRRYTGTSTGTQSNSTIFIIVGVTIGTLVLIALIAVIVYFSTRNRRTTTEESYVAAET